MKSKIRELITVFLIQLVLTLPFYTASVYGLSISNVRVTKVAANSATVEWSTDTISNGRVRYGATQSFGFTQRHDNFVENHSVTLLNGISSNTEYFFAVESTDLNGIGATDNNSNNFYTFKTKDITPPSKVSGLNAAAASNSVFLSWNMLIVDDLSHYIIYRNRIAIGNSTEASFNDTGLAPNQDFSYQVSAVDTSGNEGAHSDTLVASTLPLDSSLPAISDVDVIQVTDTTAKVTWLTDENSTTIVLYGINKTDKIKSSNELATNHSISIDGLLKNVNYIFVVKSCDKANNCANSSSQSFVGGKDVTPPFINALIPRFANRRVIDITGTTEPFSSVTLFINDMGIPKRSLGNDEVANGKFAFNSMQLEQENIIKIIAVDKSGNKNQKTFEVGVDTEDPVVQLNEIPKLTSKDNITIKGTVNEQVVITVFADANVNDSAVPSKISGLNATKIGQNSVELQWDESKDKDFSHYAVYRNDEAIALTKPANFNLYIDALVDSGKSYTYRVSAVNIFGREGPLSEPVTATTLSGGALLNIQPQKVDILEDFRKPLIVVNASDSFDFGIRLDKRDGEYKIRIVFEDKAGNSVRVEKNVVLDTKKPEVKITSPPAGAFIFENVANEIMVAGKTEPNARVHLFVDRTPFSFYNTTLELSGLPNEIQNVPEAELDAKCRSSIAASFCRTGADFSVTADNQGEFEFEKVDLTAIFGGASRLKEVQVKDFRDVGLNEEAKESKKATLVVIATDPTGQRGVATQTVNIGTCWSGNQSWDIVPLTQYQSPTLLSTERLAEGTETIYFYFNYSYMGRGSNAKITGISLSKACGTREVIDPRFNISCQVLPAGDRPTKLNKESTLSYSAVTLSKIAGMDKFLEDDWKSFFKATGKELTFPFKARITYKHTIIDDNGASREVTETQTTCEQVSYNLDNTLIDPRKVLPDWMLFDFVDFLDSSTQTLTKAQEQINKLLEYVAVGCLASFGLNFALQVYRRWTTSFEEIKFAGKKTVDDVVGAFTAATEGKQYENDCKEIITKISKAHGNTFKIKYMNDIDLKRCFPSIAKAWESEAKVYSLMRWSCDRIFGHAAPAKWTETKSDEDLIRKVESGESCSVDPSVKGQSLKAESCTEFAKKYPNFKAAASFGQDAKCILLKTKESGKLIDEVYTVGVPVSGSDNLYTINHITIQGALSGKTTYAVKRDEFNYITAQTKTCAEICGNKDGASSQFNGPAGTKFYVSKPADPKKKAGEKEYEQLAGCATVETCRTVGANKKVYVGGLEKEVSSFRTEGFTNDCFYNPETGSAGVVSNNPAQRVECCCLNSKKSTAVKYYQPTDIDPATQKPVHESKTANVLDLGYKGATDFADMKWSYRYYKEKFEAQGTDALKTVHKEYNPNRYIEGRDLPACFGQNNLLYEMLGEKEKVMVVDPFKQHEASLQCAHLAGISNRLQMIKNLMTSMSTCLKQVRVTGRGDAGACKELFTQYVCGNIWQVVRWFSDKCSPLGVGTDMESQDNNAAKYLKSGIKGVYDSITDLQSSLTQEYQNVKLNEMFGMGEESIARKICLGAFGYDWEINAKSIVDAAYATPFATLVQPITKSREFLTVDPVSLKAKYEYRASWLINPGCDFERYDVYLSCAGRKQLNQYPNSISCSRTGDKAGYSQCDCIELPDEKSTLVLTGGRLKQNVLEDKKDIHKVVDSDVRYDHLKFVLRPDRKITPTMKPNCFPTGYDDGVFYFPITDKSPHDIVDCTVDLASGLFNCGGGSAFFSRKGTASIIEVTINDNKVSVGKSLELGLGDQLYVGAKVTKTGQDKCLRVSMTPDNVPPQSIGITLNGTNDIPPLLITNKLEIAGKKGNSIPQAISHEVLLQNNQKQVEISVAAFDNDKDESQARLYSKDDKVVIDGNQIDFSWTEEKTFGTTKIKVNDKTISIKKDGIEVEIRDISYPQTPTGKYELTGAKMTFESIVQTTGSQQKTIIVELMHLKEDRDSFTNSEDCNPNDKIDERKYTVTVSAQKAIDAKKQAPLIRNLLIRPKSQIIIGQDATISALITHPEGIEKATITIKKPDGTIVDKKEIPSVGDYFEYIFGTGGKEKGMYKGEIEAVSKAKTNALQTFEFELKENV